MTPEDYKFIQDYVKKKSGIVLAEGKEYLLESRLAPIARARGLGGVGDIITEVRNPLNNDLREEVVEAMTTNESFFFRDKTPFERFNEVIAPAMLRSRAASKKLRIWCAAASTGQEPYSLAMCINERPAEFGTWQIDIIGTDLSREALEKAKAGLYTQFEVQRGLPIKLLVKYFEQTGELWQIEPGLRSMIDYRAFNLLDDFSSLGKFDIVFCRNVLIYFDEETKRDILNRIAAQLAPDGYLLMGAAETVIGLTDQFVRSPDHSGLYIKQPADEQTPARPARLFSAQAG